MRAARSTVFAVLLAAVACGGKHERDPARAASGGAGGSTGEAGASAMDAGVEPNWGSCEIRCATKADCCADCTYPNEFDCSNRHCVSLGCSSDADCARVHGLESLCRTVSGTRRCIEPCVSDADCSDGRAFCGGRDEQGHSFCGRLPGLPVPCTIGSTCSAGFGVCNPMTFQCGCWSDEQCPPDRVCIPAN